METTALNKKLIAAGLNSQQIESKTAKVIVDVLAEDQGLLLAEVKAQVAQAKNAAESAKYRVGELYQRHTEAIEHADRLIEALAAQNDACAELSTDVAKDTLILFTSMLKVCSSYDNVDMGQAIESVGYIMYAMLGGQAKRDYGEKLFEKEKY